jgi:hypothetical protein
MHRLSLGRRFGSLEALHMSATLYEPINVYKPLGQGIGTVDGPFEYFAVAGLRMPMPFTTRMTIVGLAGGDLFLHSPIAYDEKLATRLRELGTVRHLISPNQWHYAHIGEWQKAFPDATAWASPGVRRRARARHIDVHFTRDLCMEPPPEWSDEIDQTLIPGGIFKEFVFFHRASRTLILADTIMNFELDKLDQPWSAFTRLSGMDYPRGQIFFGMRLAQVLQRKRTQEAFEKVRSWAPQRIVLSHGRCFDDANDVMRRIFGGK